MRALPAERADLCIRRGIENRLHDLARDRRSGLAAVLIRALDDDRNCDLGILRGRESLRKRLTERLDSTAAVARSAAEWSPEFGTQEGDAV